MAAPPALRTWTTGELTTAAMLNTNIRDAITALLSPPHVLLTKTGNASVTNNLWTAVGWDTEVVDTDNMHSVFTDTTRITIAVAGLYDVRGSVQWAAATGGGRGMSLDHVAPGTRYSMVRGGAVSTVASPSAGPITTLETTVNSGIPVFLNAGDQIEMTVYQDSGGALNMLGGYSVGDMLSWFSARWIAAG